MLLLNEKFHEATMYFASSFSLSIWLQWRGLQKSRRKRANLHICVSFTDIHKADSPGYGGFEEKELLNKLGIPQRAMRLDLGCGTESELIMNAANSSPSLFHSRTVQSGKKVDEVILQPHKSSPLFRSALDEIVKPTSFAYGCVLLKNASCIMYRARLKGGPQVW